MKTVEMYELDEEVIIKAKVTQIEVEDGEIKYHLKTEYANNDIGHLFSADEIIGSLEDLEEVKDSYIS